MLMSYMMCVYVLRIPQILMTIVTNGLVMSVEERVHALRTIMLILPQSGRHSVQDK